MFNGKNNGHHRNGTGNGLVHANSLPRTGYGGNGQKPDAALDATPHDLLWDGLSPAVTNALGQPLDPALVSQRKGRGGRVFDYLEGHVVIDQANRVFGYGGWGMELVGDVTLRQIETVDTQTGEVKVTSAYSAPVRVTVAGALPRTDIGFHAVAEDNAEGHDTAIKGSVTDGMKRALRSFGVQFGNGSVRRPATGGRSGPDRSACPPRPTAGPAQFQTSRPIRQTQRVPGRTTSLRYRPCESSSSRSPSSRASTRTVSAPPWLTAWARASTT